MANIQKQQLIETTKVQFFLLMKSNLNYQELFFLLIKLTNQFLIIIFKYNTI
jgi:hypothetical protein